MLFTFVLLVAVELTLAKTKPDALFFVICVLVLGLDSGPNAQRLSGTRTLTVSKEFANIVRPTWSRRCRRRSVKPRRSS